MSFANYKRYNEYKGFEEKLKKLYVCKNGDSITGNLNLNCNDLLNVKNINICSGGKINGDIQFTTNVIVDGKLDLSGSAIFNDVSINNLDVLNNFIVNGSSQLNDASINNLDLSGNLQFNCNDIIGVNSVTFCDGTYLGPGNSFDISTNEVLHFKTSQNILFDGDTTFNNNVEIGGNLTVRGTTTQVSTQQLFIKDNVIEINQTMDASGNVDPSGILPNPTNFQSGFVVYRGPDPADLLDPSAVRPPYQFLYDESSNTFQLGKLGEEQPVATREDMPNINGAAVWDASTNRFVTDRNFYVDPSGNVDICCNLNVSGTTHLNDVSLNNTDIYGNMNLNSNIINDVSGIYFSNGTYIGHGNSFDISTNEVIHITSSQNVIFDSAVQFDTIVHFNNISVSGGVNFNSNEIDISGIIVTKDLSVNGMIYHSNNFSPSIAGGTQTLSDVLAIGNKANRDIDMSLNSIINISDLSVNGIIYHSNQFSPSIAGGAQSWAQVLDTGNKANQSIDMSSNNITDVSNIFFTNLTNYIDTINAIDASMSLIDGRVETLDASMSFVETNIIDLSINKFDKTGGNINGNVEISGNTLLQSKLLLNGDASFNGNVDISGTLTTVDLSVNGIIYHSGQFSPSIAGGTQTLSDVLALGNKATRDIDMSFNSIIAVSNILFSNSSNYNDTIERIDSSINDLSNNKFDKLGGLINGDVDVSGTLTTIDLSVNGIIYHSGQFSPSIAGGTQTLSDVLALGNKANRDIDMSFNSIIAVSNILFSNSSNYNDTIERIDSSINDLSNNKFDKLGGLINGDVDVSGTLTTVDLSVNGIIYHSGQFSPSIAGGTQTLSDVLALGNKANRDIDMSFNSIIDLYDVSNSNGLLYLNNKQILDENSIIVNTVKFDIRKQRNVNETDKNYLEFLFEQIDKDNEILLDENNTDIIGINKWGGAITAPTDDNNFGIFMIPADYTKIMLFKPLLNEQFNLYDISINPNLENKWRGAVYYNADNNTTQNSPGSAKVIGIPYNHTHILTIENRRIGIKDGIKYHQIPSEIINDVNKLNVLSNNEAWISGCASPINPHKIYMCPGRARHILIYDSLTDDISGIILPDSIKDLPGIKFSTSIVSTNNKIYMFPRDISSVISIDTDSNDVSLVELNNIPNNDDNSSTDRFYGGVLATNKKMYITPFKNRRILEFDPVDNSYNFIQLPLSPLVDFNSDKKNWMNSVLGNNGNIYAMPYQANVILEFNPITKHTRYLPIPKNILETNKFSGAILGTSLNNTTNNVSSFNRFINYIYGIPCDENKILEVCLTETKRNKSWMEHYFFNKV